MNNFPDEKFDPRDGTKFPNLIRSIPRTRAIVIRTNGIINRGSNGGLMRRRGPDPE